MKRRRLGKEESSKEATQKESKSTSSSKGASRSQPKSSGKSAQAEEHGPRVDDLEEPLHQEFNTGNDDISLSVVELEYHLEEVFKATNDQLDWPNPEGRPIIVVTSLKIMEFFGYKHLEEITVRRQDYQLYRIYTRLIVIQERVEDLQLAVKSYQKKINLSRPDSYRSNLRKITPYTAYHDIQSIIYQDDMDINCLMRTDELHKFSDGTLNHVRTALNDIATGI
ncbi:hypothetical protein Tco_0506763 [Tanacetum coccineum]